MPAPSDFFYSDACKNANQVATRDLIDAGSAAGKIKLYDNDDDLLATITLSDPCGTVSAAGVLTITAPSAATATAAGTCTYGTITDSADTVILTAPASQGSQPVSGDFVLSAVALIIGSNVSVLSFQIGS